MALIYIMMTRLEQETYNSVKEAARELIKFLSEEKKSRAAMYAMMGKLASGSILVNPDALAKGSIKFGEALINELDNKGMTFILSQKQKEEADRIYKEKGNIQYIFTSTGIGYNVKVKVIETGEEFDITDYDTW